MEKKEGDWREDTIEIVLVECACARSADRDRRARSMTVGEWWMVKSGTACFDGWCWFLEAVLSCTSSRASSAAPDKWLPAFVFSIFAAFFSSKSYLTT